MAQASSLVKTKKELPFISQDNKMKFVLESFWLTKDRLPYVASRGSAKYSIRRIGDYEELSVMRGEYGYDHDSMLRYICEKHGLNKRSMKVTLMNGPWIFYQIKGFDWKSHEEWSNPLIEKQRISELAERLAEFDTADLEKVLRLRNKE